MRFRQITLWLALLFAAPVAWGQSAPVTSKNLSGTIAATGTFQLIQALNANRLGCSIQNNGSNAMWVYFGSSPTTAASVQLAAGQSVACAVASAIVITDPVYITGTAADAFYANFQ